MKHLLTFSLIICLGSAAIIFTKGQPELPQNTSPILSLFSPGFYDKHSVSTQQAARYAKNNILQGAYTACTYNDTRTYANFGQDGDITFLSEQYKGCCNASNDTRVVLAGISRGASVLFNFIGKEKPENIAAVIAESPFASVNDIIEYKISQWHAEWLPGIQYFTFALMKLLYPAYKINGPQPIISTKQHCISAPILIACSKEDNIIPYTSSVRLAHTLKEKGYNVYLLIFQKGAHGYLSYKEEFQQIANALYACYNLPHNPELAQQGTIKLERCKL